MRPGHWPGERWYRAQTNCMNLAAWQGAAYTWPITSIQFALFCTFFSSLLLSSFLHCKRIRFSGQDKRHSSHHYLRKSSKKRLISRNENMPRQDQDRFQKASCQDERPRSFITLSKEYKESLCQSRYILRHNPSL